MRPRRSWLVVVAVLVVAGATSCSHGSKSGARTPPHTGKSEPTTTLSPAQIIASLARCPSGGLGGKSLSALNDRVLGADKKLVPLDSLHVQICQYDGNSERLIGMRVLGSPVAAQVERVANAQPIATSDRGGVTCTPAQPLYLVTFASDKQHVTTLNGCLAVSNGDFLAHPTEKWLSDLRSYITPPAPHGPATTS